MPGDVEHLERDIRELYDSRNNHSARISIMESAVNDMRDFMREYHKETKQCVDKIQTSIDSFIKEVNGTPAQNKEKIESLQGEVKAIDKHITYWVGGLAAISGLLGLFVMGIEIYSKIKK